MFLTFFNQRTILNFNCDFYLSFFQIVGKWRDFTVVIKLIENFKHLYGFGGCCLKIRDIWMDFKPSFKVHNLVSVHPKSIILGQFIDWLKFETQFPPKFRNGQLYMYCGTFIVWFRTQVKQTWETDHFILWFA